MELDPAINSLSPLALHHTDNPAVAIVLDLLDGTNYVEWSTAVRRGLSVGSTTFICLLDLVFSIQFKLSNYSSYEGVLYCKPHFDQLFKMTGSLDKSFEGAPRTARVDRSTDPGVASSKVLSMFAGTQDKCVACNKTVYPLEKVAVDGTSYHKACFKCSHGGCTISPSNYVAHEHRLYCRHHHTQLFKQKGNFSQLDKQEQATKENGTEA